MSLFRNELYYDTAKGVPYWQQILGHFPPVPVMKAAFEQAALSVPGVVSATVYLAAVQGRRLTGQVQITTADGQTATVGIVPLASEATGIPFRLNTSLLNSGVLLE